MSVWKRPENVPWPQVWLREKGFVIRDVTPDIEPYVVEHMVANFAVDEPLNKSSGLGKDPVATADIVRLWVEDLLPQRVSIVALREGTPGADLEPVGPANPPAVIGANMLGVVHREDPPSPPLEQLYKSKIAVKVLSTVARTGKLVDVFQKYHVDHYLDAAGLSVSASTRGQGLGYLLLEARLALCRGLGIPLTKTVFTNIASQRIADKAGFEVLAETVYEEMRGEDGEVLFANMEPTKVIQLSACVP